MTSEKLGRYEILGELGKGAMGVVYLGRDPLIGRQLALKTFRLGYSAGDKELEQFRVRFLREAQSAGILTHPNIVTIHDVAVDPNGDCFIAMEYVQGTDLKIVMQRQERLDPKFTIEIVAQIADGLSYAHSKGVVHRDIKPANIILTKEKQAKITDFGIARVETSNLTMEGQLLGTPNYMSPEQIQGKEVDHRADIFSLGVMLYEMVTGQKPFFGENLSAVTHRIVFGDFTPPEKLVPGLPAGFAHVLGRALAKDPEQRYSSGGEMAQDLRAILEPTATASRSSSFLAPSPQPSVAAVPAGTVSAPAAPIPSAAPGPSAAPAPAAAALPSPPAVPAAEGTLVNTAPAGMPPAAAQAPGAPQATVAGTPPAATIAPGPVAPGSVAPGSAALGPASPAPASPETAGQPSSSPSPFLRRPTPGRMAMAAAVALALALVAAGVAQLVMRPEDVPTTQANPELELQRQILPLAKEGRRLLQEGDPVAALEAFEGALAVAPDDRELRRLRDRAEREVLQSDGVALEESYITERLEAARQSLRRRDYEGTIKLAQQVLEVNPDHPTGKQLLVDARSGQRRQEQLAQRRAQTQPPPAPAGSQQPAAAAPSASAPAGEATLAVEFFSLVPEGRLTIFNGQQKIHQQSFKFTAGKAGFLRRARRTSGSLQESLTLPAGDLDLRVYVWRKGSQTKTSEIKGNLPAGGTRVLGIEVSEEGRVSLELE
ncbi:MAG: protein kinase [Acidobacteriota bacterium]